MEEQNFWAKMVEVSRTVRVLLELKIEDEKIKQILVKYFDLRYVQASNILEEEKLFLRLDITVRYSHIKAPSCFERCFFTFITVSKLILHYRSLFQNQPLGLR